jgi:hemoglobin-like flavoprotein
MQRQRRGLQAAANRCPARRCRDDGSATDEIAFAIVDMLFDHAREWSRTCVRGPRIEDTRRRHRLLGVTARHYSCFGDALAAIIKDRLGTLATPSLTSAWGDAYWTIVRSLSRQEAPIAA